MKRTALFVAALATAPAFAAGVSLPVVSSLPSLTALPALPALPAVPTLPALNASAGGSLALNPTAGTASGGGSLIVNGTGGSVAVDSTQTPPVSYSTVGLPTLPPLPGL